MPTENEKFKTILEFGKLVCNQQFLTLQRQFAITQPAVLQSFQIELTNAFSPFDKPEIWVGAIVFDAGKLNEQIARIIIADPNDLTGCMKLHRTFFAMLQNTLPVKPATNPPKPVFRTTVANAKMIDALRLTGMAVEAKKADFKKQGTDLDADPAFQALNAERQKWVSTYHDLLRADKLQANDLDLKDMKDFKQSFEQVKLVSMFLRFFKGMTNWVKLKVASVPIA